MKQIPLLQGKALLIELPEGAKMEGLQTTSPNAIVYADTHGHGVILDLPPGNWRIIGMLSEVTEEQAIPLVDKERFIVDGPDLGFRNYKGNKYDWFGTAIESLYSAIEAEGWTFSNPYGMERPPNLPIDAIPYDQQPGYRAFRNTKPHLQPNDIELSYEFYCLAWQKAQSRVLCRERCLLLGREGI